MVIVFCKLQRHGVDEPRNPWSDGPEYITQCPIQPGGNFTQRIDLTNEEGTLWWHAHSDWDRATLYGAIVVRPTRGTSFPFSKPQNEIPILLGVLLEFLLNFDRSCSGIKEKLKSNTNYKASAFLVVKYFDAN